MAAGRHPASLADSAAQGARHEVIHRLGRQDAIVSLLTSPQARKQWPGLPETLQARLLSKTVKGKVRQILTSMTDPLRFPPDEIVDLYSQRWEIELGYRQMKQSMLDSRYTLRSKTPEMIEQELMGSTAGLQPAALPDAGDESPLPGDLPLQDELHRLHLGDPGVTEWPFPAASGQYPQILGRVACVSHALRTAASAGRSLLPSRGQTQAVQVSIQK
ncbi:transposase [Azorhizophilus paspali]|uniref:Transposase n=1 Tax=Azorhizophilus paspali TaxID=69963 RepID=A0ABV6SRF5_AZOPA